MAVIHKGSPVPPSFLHGVWRWVVVIEGERLIRVQCVG